MIYVTIHMYAYLTYVHAYKIYVCMYTFNNA